MASIKAFPRMPVPPVTMIDLPSREYILFVIILLILNLNISVILICWIIARLMESGE